MDEKKVKENPLGIKSGDIFHVDTLEEELMKVKGHPLFEATHRTCLNQAETIKKLQSLLNLTEDLIKTKKDLSFEIAHGLQAETKIKGLEKEIETIQNHANRLGELIHDQTMLRFELEARIKELEGGIEKHKSAKSQRMNLVGEEDNLLLVSSIDKDDEELYKLIKKK